MTTTPTRIAGHAIVEQLVAYGVKRVFGVPGESYLDVLDGLYEHRSEIEMVITRQEGGAAMMAAAHGQATGEVGVCMVTRGPGASNASIGVHVASQDASPMLLCIGQIPRVEEGRQAFQEVDYRAMFGSLAKEVIEINLPDRAPELMAHAMNVALSGEPGPVVVVFPEDVLSEPTAVPIIPRYPRPAPRPAPSEIERAIELLESAKRPLIITGRSDWDEQTAILLQTFAEKSQIPVATTVRRQDAIDNRSSVYVGTLGLSTTLELAELVEESDTILLLGTRPDGVSFERVGVQFPDDPERRFIHVYPDAKFIGRVYPSEVASVCSPWEFLRALPEKIAASPEREQWRKRLRGHFEFAFETALRSDAMGAYVQVFDKYFGSDIVTTVGAGNYTAWVQRLHHYTRVNSQIATQSGAMGYGIPAAVAAAMAYPDRTVVSLAGDGCFMMNGQELSTAVRYGLDILVILVNNSRYGTIRDHQERRYPARVVGTSLENPDFVQLAEAYGARARRVTSPDEFDAALADLAELEGIRFIEVVLDV